MEQSSTNLEKLLLEKRVLELESKLIKTKINAFHLRQELENSIFTRRSMSDLVNEIEKDASFEPMLEASKIL